MEVSELKAKTKRFAVLAVIIIIVAILEAFTFLPKKIVDENDYIVGLRFVYNDVQLPVDQNEIVKILSKYDSIRTFKYYFPYEGRKINFEIDFVANNKPVHILLGEFNVWYNDADKAVYEIKNAAQLKQELKDALSLK